MRHESETIESNTVFSLTMDRCDQARRHASKHNVHVEQWPIHNKAKPRDTPEICHENCHVPFICEEAKGYYNLIFTVFTLGD